MQIKQISKWTAYSTTSEGSGGSGGGGGGYSSAGGYPGIAARYSGNSPSTSYVIFYTAYYYTTEAAYNSKACYLDSISDTISLTDEQITTNIFARIYEQISSNYNNVTNLL